MGRIQVFSFSLVKQIFMCSWRHTVSLHHHSNIAFDLSCVQMLKCNNYWNKFTAFLHFCNVGFCQIHSFRKCYVGVCCENHGSRDQRTQGRRIQKSQEMTPVQIFYQLLAILFKIRKPLSSLNLWMLGKPWILSWQCGDTSLGQWLENFCAVLETNPQI